MSSERDLIATIARRVAKATAQGAPTLPQGSCLLQGIGDDCAVLRPDPAALSLLTTDTLVEGVHFDLSWHPPGCWGARRWRSISAISPPWAAGPVSSCFPWA